MARREKKTPLSPLYLRERRDNTSHTSNYSKLIMTFAKARVEMLNSKLVWLGACTLTLGVRKESAATAAYPTTNVS